MRSRQLYGSVTATGQLYFDMPNNSRIRGVVFSATPSATAANGDYIELEVSLQSTNQTTTSDAQDIIATASFSVNGSGTPASMGVTNGNFYCPSDLGAKSGDRVYLNYTEQGGSTWRIRANIWFD